MRFVWIATIPFLLLAALRSQAPSSPAIAAAAFAQGTLGQVGAASAPAADEFVGPFANWVNVRTLHLAVGDGVADDTAALQGALDRLAPGTTTPVVFIPAGTYRITRSLSLNLSLGVALIGEDPERTRIVWDGPAGGTLLFARGVAYSRISRLTFDGRGKAAVAVEQTFDNTRGNFDTGNEYADDRFIDVEYGIRGGFEGFGFAETSVMRARFIRNSKAGIALGNFNALDLWVWHSLFEDCGVGVTNDPGAGNYRVYSSIFRRSKTADLMMQNTGGFTARHNYSVGSKAFWISGSPLNHPATIDIQDNTIIDPRDPLVVRLANQGPGLIMDNRIRSLPNTGGPIVSWSSLFGSDVVSIGNTFTVSNAVSANGRLLTLDDRVVTRDGIAAREPVLPAAQPNLSRRVYEVAAGAGADAIQRAIDVAAREGGARPVVHLPMGRYTVERTLEVPASDVQLVGDGPGTVLRWAGTGRGPVMALQSPSRVTLRELQVDGANLADGIVAAGIDQDGARAYLEGVQLRGGHASNLRVDGVDRATVQLVDFGHAYSGDATSVQIAGGPAAGTPGANGRTIIYSGASAGHHLSYDVSGRATLVARDIWYEGTALGGFMRVRDGARVVLQGARVATPKDWTPPAFVIEPGAGRFTLLTTLFDDRIVVTGSGGGDAEIMGLAILREESAMPSFTNNSATPARTLIRNLRQRTRAGGLIPRGTVPVADVGTMDADVVHRMLRDTRELREPSLEAVPAGATDLRMFRVWISSGQHNLLLRGAAR